MMTNINDTVVKVCNKILFHKELSCESMPISTVSCSHYTIHTLLYSMLQTLAVADLTRSTRK